MKKSYSRKALLLALFIPFDLLAYLISFIFCAIWNRKAKLVFVTDIFPELIARSAEQTSCFVGPPNLALLAVSKRGFYVPASFGYQLLAFSRWSSRASKEVGPTVAIWLMELLLRQFVEPGGTMIFHSDALPFARSVLAAGRRLGLRACCIQHGIFHESAAISEVDGYLCDINVARSSDDARLIREASSGTFIVTEPDFFLSCSVDGSSTDIRKVNKAVLLGEAWDLVDGKFEKEYMRRLQSLGRDLEAQGFDVVFRPHPSDKSLWRYGFRKLERCPLASCIATTDVVVGYSSTVLFEAASVGKSACQIDVDGEFFPGLNRDGVAIEKVSSASDIARVVALRSDEGCNNHVEMKRAAIERVWQLLQKKGAPT